MLDVIRVTHTIKIIGRRLYVKEPIRKSNRKRKRRRKRKLQRCFLHFVMADPISDLSKNALSLITVSREALAFHLSSTDVSLTARVYIVDLDEPTTTFPQRQVASTGCFEPFINEFDPRIRLNIL